MVKIIKDGEREFTGYCYWCGCEFTYELSDIIASLYVTCPFCNNPRAWTHPNQVTLNIVPQIVPKDYLDTTNTTTIKNGEIDFWKSQPKTEDNPFLVTVDTGDIKPL